MVDETTAFVGATGSCRQRMINDMMNRQIQRQDLERLYPTHQESGTFLGRSPQTASNEDLRRFQLHLTEKDVGRPTINSTVSALRFFFTDTRPTRCAPAPDLRGGKPLRVEKGD
jgi:integrase/recombinase XerD